MQSASHDYESDVTCNLCGSSDVREMPRHAVEARAQLRDAWGCRLVECKSCGLRFYSPRLTEDYAVQTFLHGNDAKAEAESMARKGVFFGEPQGSAAEQIESLRIYYTTIFDGLVEKYAAQNGRPPRAMFELGSSVGWFAKAACARAKEKWDGMTYAGCDANIFAAEIGRNEFGLDIQGTTFSKYAIQPEQIGAYDLLVAFDFLEHSYTPRSDLQKLRTLASKNACLIIKTFVDDNDPEGNYVHPVFHHHHFTLRTLRAVVEKAGWKIVDFNDKSEWIYSQVTVTATA